MMKRCLSLWAGTSLGQPHTCCHLPGHDGPHECRCGETLSKSIPIQTRRETPELQTWTDAHQARADASLAPRHPKER